MNRPQSVGRLPGFRDFPPEELAIRSHLFECWRRVSRRYGFMEYDGPPLEALELYTEKSGDEIVQQLYTFTDKGDREVALRPEMTPSLARILGERSRALPKPIRWFSIPQLFRYERQQRGRLREHFQWNVDVVGEAGPRADAEVLAVALDALKELGLGPDRIHARISHRPLLSALLEGAGVGVEGHPTAFGVIDKLGREPREKALVRLEEGTGLTPARGEELLELLAEGDTQALISRYGTGGGASAAAESGAEELASVVETLEALGLGPYLTPDLTIVRGLAYYTGTVFEIFDRKGDFRAICGGGRYDSLLARTGGEDLPAVGFGMGDVVLTELLGDEALLPPVERQVDDYVVVVDPRLHILGLEVAATLRGQGRSVVYALRPQAVRKQLSAAAQEGAQRAVILGPDEVASGRVSIRDMVSGDTWEMPLDDFRTGQSEDGSQGA
ncbi:MAG: histidine--tRNA ligase [Gemmatimonadota bacterium]